MDKWLSHHRVAVEKQHRRDRSYKLPHRRPTTWVCLSHQRDISLASSSAPNRSHIRHHILSATHMRSKYRRLSINILTSIIENVLSRDCAEITVVAHRGMRNWVLSHVSRSGDEATERIESVKCFEVFFSLLNCVYLVYATSQTYCPG